MKSCFNHLLSKTKQHAQCLQKLSWCQNKMLIIVLSDADCVHSGLMSIEHVIIFPSKHISKGAVDLRFSPMSVTTRVTINTKKTSSGIKLCVIKSTAEMNVILVQKALLVMSASRRLLQEKRSAGIAQEGFRLILTQSLTLKAASSVNSDLISIGFKSGEGLAV